MRLFLAVTPDARARESLAAGSARVRRTLADVDRALRWVESDSQHLTLHFLGEVEAPRVPAVEAILGQPIPCPSFDLSLGRAIANPSAGPPRVVWLTVTGGAETLSAVYRILAERLVAAGFPVAPRPFHPHLTLARVRHHERHTARPLRRLLEGIAPADVAWRVDEVVLFESDLSGPTPTHTRRMSCRLGSVA